MTADIILIDFHTSNLTMRQVLSRVKAYQKIMPDHEIFMDGDAYAIVARKRKVCA